LKLEERAEVGNDPKVAEELEKTRATMRKFKEWLAHRDARLLHRSAETKAADPSDEFSDVIPSFREWLAQQEAAAGREP
jgi:hypothetical protein